MTVPDLQGLHRASRIVLECGAERDIAKADAVLRRLAVQLVLGPSILDSAVLQTAVLTAVNAGSRTFLGGVHVVGASGIRACTPLARTADLGSAAERLGAKLLDDARSDIPTIVVGCDARWPKSAPLSVRIQVQDWRAAVLPADDGLLLNDASSLPLAGVFAAALALSEVFSAQMSLHPEAGRREVGFSLWEPDPTGRWQRALAGPELEYLPSELSLIGLGHLGQACLWSLGSLPYRQPERVEIALQDRDVLGGENLSTCLLTTRASVNKPKVRIVAQWLEEHGFRTRMIERWFFETDRFSNEDPRLVLVGVDSPKTRADVATAAREARDGVQLLDVGLGSGTLDFDELVLHSSPFSSSDVQRWRAAQAREQSRVAAHAESRRMGEIAAASGLDACGKVQLAGLAVGVPFVGAAAGAIVVAEVLRRLAGAPAVRTVSLRLRDPRLGAPAAFHSMAPVPIAFVRRQHGE